MTEIVRVGNLVWPEGANEVATGHAGISPNRRAAAQDTSTHEDSSASAVWIMPL